MAKFDKEFFINHFEDLIINEKNILNKYMNKFIETNADDDLNQIIYCAESIRFNVELLEILKNCESKNEKF